MKIHPGYYSKYIVKHWKKLLFCCGCVAVKPVMPKCSVPEAVTVGSSTELRCIENEGFPQSQYQWFKNNEELPEDPKTSSKFYNSSYTMNTETGSLVSVLWHASKNNLRLLLYFNFRSLDYILRYHCFARNCKNNDLFCCVYTFKNKQPVNELH